MHITKKAVAGAVLAGTAVASIAMAPVGSAGAATPCYTNDSVYVSNQGVTASGVLAWADSHGGAYRINLSNTRNGVQGRMVVDFYKHNIGWIDRFTWSQADGVASVASRTFVKDYQVDKVRFGVTGAGQDVHTLVFDVNSACGA